MHFTMELLNGLRDEQDGATRLEALHGDLRGGQEALGEDVTEVVETTLSLRTSQTRWDVEGTPLMTEKLLQVVVIRRPVGSIDRPPRRKGRGRRSGRERWGSGGDRERGVIRMKGDGV